MTFYYLVERVLKLLLWVVPGEPHKRARCQAYFSSHHDCPSDPGLFLALRREMHSAFHTICYLWLETNFHPEFLLSLVTFYKYRRALDLRILFLPGMNHMIRKTAYFHLLLKCSFSRWLNIKQTIHMKVSAQWTKSAWNWKDNYWSQEFPNLAENLYSHLSDFFLSFLFIIYFCLNSLLLWYFKE